jgi:hypothetical protein
MGAKIDLSAWQKSKFEGFSKQGGEEERESDRRRNKLHKGGGAAS